MRKLILRPCSVTLDETHVHFCHCALRRRHMHLENDYFDDALEMWLLGRFENILRHTVQPCQRHVFLLRLNLELLSPRSNRQHCLY